MNQFDVCRLRQPPDQLVVILQHDLIDQLGTRVVAPLSERPYRALIEALRVPVELDVGSYVVQLDRVAAIEQRMIGQVVGTLAAEERRIKRGLDLLFLGV